MQGSSWGCGGLPEQLGTLQAQEPLLPLVRMPPTTVQPRAHRSLPPPRDTAHRADSLPRGPVTHPAPTLAGTPPSSGQASHAQSSAGLHTDGWGMHTRLPGLWGQALKGPAVGSTAEPSDCSLPAWMAHTGRLWTQSPGPVSDGGHVLPSKEGAGPNPWPGLAFSSSRLQSHTRHLLKPPASQPWGEGRGEHLHVYSKRGREQREPFLTHS